MALPTYLYSGVCYVATGSQSTFALTTATGKSIKYLAPSHIKVRTSADSGSTWVQLNLGTDWLFADPPVSIVLTTPAASGVWVDIHRTTPLDESYIKFEDGNLLTAQQLNTFDDWQLFIDQEIVDSVVSIDGTLEIGTTDELPEGQVNLYYTDQRVQNVLDEGGYITDPGVEQIVAGQNITISPENGKGVVRINSLGGGGDQGGMTYKGTVDATMANAGSNENGDLYVNIGVGTVEVSWTGIAGQSVSGNEQLIYNGTSATWNLLSPNGDTTGIPEAPNDGELYGRQSQGWSQVNVPEAPVQSDWNVTDDTSLRYIKNKPTVDDQIQSDWDVADAASPAYIKNKPIDPSAPTLQAVCEKGNSTTTKIQAAGYRIDTLALLP